jgi:hypothetical protein
MQPVRESYAALISTEALKAWQPSVAVFTASDEAPFTDVTNSTAISMQREEIKR